MLHWCSLLSDQPVSGCSGCIFPSDTPQPVHLRGLVRSRDFGKFIWQNASCADPEANVWKYESCNNQTADALDAYQRAFDLDPSNMHIKARLQLLRNNGQSTGLPNQQNAPVPQDVHPQQYQAAGVGAPPGPQWGVPAGGPASILHGPAQGQNGTALDWSRRLADIPNPQPPQTSSMYDQRDPIRPPPSQRQASPRQDQIRQYQEQQRHTPLRRPSPPPSMNHNPPVSYTAPQALPQPQPSVSQPPVSNRIPNPNYGAPDPGLRLATGSHQPGPASRVPYGRGDSPPPEIRPIADPSAPSPGHSLHSQVHYQHHPNTSQSVGIAAGAPPPMAALAAAEAAAARERDDRPVAGYKRSHESDEDYKMPNKLHANGENRNRLENATHRRASPPDRKPSPRPRQASPHGRQQSPYGRPASPPIRHSRSSSTARREEQRKTEESYHPSEAAHHPHVIPSMQSQPPAEPPQTPASTSEVSREERREAYEPGARTMEVDEDYDDDAEEDKRKVRSGGRNSPQHNTMNGQPKVEVSA